MIKEPTVLILGAGASMDYGFPSGRQLLTEVVGRCESGSGIDFFTELGFSQFEVKEFAQTLRRSGRQSVDAFLEHQPNYVELGKAAIAEALMRFENPEALFPLNRKQHWYEYLFGRMNAPLEEFGDNRLSVVTYNYDRSLEHYLLTTLQNAYSTTPENCAEILAKLPIIHLHGQLGPLPALNQGHGRQYIPGAQPQDVAQWKDSIRIVHEDIRDDPHFQKAHELLRSAKRVYFIGFGYDAVNLKRLELSNVNIACRVLGSAYNLTGAEVSR